MAKELTCSQLDAVARNLSTQRSPEAGSTTLFTVEPSEHLRLFLLSANVGTPARNILGASGREAMDVSISFLRTLWEKLVRGPPTST